MVVAFEPHCDLFLRLKEHIALNELADVQALDVALGAVEDSRLLFEVPSVSIGRGSSVDPGLQGRPAGEGARAPPRFRSVSVDLRSAVEDRCRRV
jgi:hypothetical protein